MTLGQKLISLRKSRGMTQEELSEAIGVTRQTISKWELDTSTPDLDYLCKLCDLFGVTADYLIRPDRETVEMSETAETAKTSETVDTSPPPPSEQSHPIIVIHQQKSKRTSLNTRPAGFVLLDIAIFFFIFGLISLFTANEMHIMFLFAGIALIFSLELLFIRWKPLFIVMWTAWVLVTILLTIGTATLLAVPLILFFHAIPNHPLPYNWHFIFFFLWLLYTAFCIGVTIHTIVKYLRKKKAQQP